MTTGRVSTLIRGARIFDGERLRADLLLVDGDPCADITATRDIAAIWRNGTRLHRQPQPIPHAAIATAPAGISG
jgi:hypothetical protein